MLRKRRVTGPWEPEEGRKTNETFLRGEPEECRFIGLKMLAELVMRERITNGTSSRWSILWGILLILLER